MFDELFSYDPKALAPKYREQMSAILRARGEFLKAQAELTDLRGRSWAGEEGLADIIDLKAADLAKLRADYLEHQAFPFLKEVVNLEALQTLLPMVALGVLNTFKVPLPVIAEAIGVDVDAFKLLAESIKDLVEEVKNA